MKTEVTELDQAVEIPRTGSAYSNRTDMSWEMRSNGGRMSDSPIASSIRMFVIERWTLSLRPDARLPSDFFQDLIIARASVGAAHIDLIEHVIEGLPIVHLGIQTA